MRLGSKLLLLRWHRLVVDDAHRLLRPAATEAAAVIRAVMAACRWLVVDGAVLMRKRGTAAAAASGEEWGLEHQAKIKVR